MNGPMKSTTEKLVDYMEASLRQAGEDLPCTKEALMVFSTGKRSEIDCFDLVNLDNQSYCDAFYMLSYNNYPTPDYIERWKKEAEQLPREKFQKTFTTFFTHEDRFSRQHVRLYNCMYLDLSAFKVDIKKRAKRLKSTDIPGYRIKVYHTFLPLYMRLPMSNRMWLKKHYRKYFFT